MSIMIDIKLHNYLKYLYLRLVKGIDTPAKFIHFFAQRNANKLIIKEGEKEYSMEYLNKRVNCLANSLLDLGLQKGNSIGVHLKNCIEFIEIRLAAYKTGFIFCALIDDFTTDQLLQKISEMNFKAFFCDNLDIVDNILKLPAKASPEHLIMTKNSEKHHKVLPYDVLIEGGNSAEPECNTKPGDFSAIGFTSGTTGESKGVIWDHRAWLQSFYHFMLNTSLAEGEMRMLQFIPFSTAGSLTLLPWIASGGKMIIKQTYSAKDLCECITREKITHVTMAPTFLIDLWDYFIANKDIYNFESLKSISVGSAPLSGQKLKQMIETFGPIIQQSYGMAEVLAPLASLRIKDPLQESNKLTSVGIPIRQIRIELMEKDYRGYGQIKITSKTACLGYWKPDGINKSCFQQNWFLTDDIGSFDKKGNLYIQERKTRIIDHTGVTIYPRDIEEVIHGYPGVKDVFVCESKNELKTYLCSRRNYTIDLPGIRSYCMQQLPERYVPDDFILKETLPVSSSGKILAITD